VRKLTVPIRTARLNLREFVSSDLEAIHAYSSDPRVTRYLFFGPRDADSSAEYLEELLASQREQPRTRFELAVEEMATARLIGACDLSLIEAKVVDLGYMLGVEQWGKGYATEITRSARRSKNAASTNAKAISVAYPLPHCSTPNM
jgi:ribosomal-protein-alanine N-acetyltransferase